DDIVGLSQNKIFYTVDYGTNWNTIPGELYYLTTGDYDGDSRDDIAGINTSGQIFYTTNLGTLWKQVTGNLFAIKSVDTERKKGFTSIE
ncbi:MAG: hypothetical protein L3V56_10885, partial [Candidatus Magnetoovum sp. WYHC-5]|nr:hypothetical protein [Candidatus Magnetoovum sp. WYHC-5]